MEDVEKIEGKSLNQAKNTATVDLGKIHLGAVVVKNRESAIIFGRGIRNEKRELNKFLRIMSKKISRYKKHSKRFKKLKIAKNRYRNKLKRKIKDLRHKATRQIVNFCVLNGVNKIFVWNSNRNRKEGYRKKT
ncbi:MAG: transposase [Rickettsia sp.]|nr:transposase [Rickettsia sp.]